MDIVKRLRLVDSSIWLSSGLADGGRLMVGEWSHEAADEIERLREALQFYSSFADALPHENIASLMIDRGNKARAALKEGE
jgi:hypothetical protein